jgi:hypothetical protein
MPIEAISSVIETTVPAVAAAPSAAAQEPAPPPAIATVAQAEAQAQATVDLLAAEGDPLAIARLTQSYTGLAATLAAGAVQLAAARLTGAAEAGKGALLDTYE